MNGDEVRDQQGTLYTLGNKLGEGGQGKVFAVDSHPRLVIKRFHDSLLQGEDAEPLKRKVAALREKRLEQTLPGGAWPQFSVFGEGGGWCGYAMRRVKGVPLLPQVFLSPGLLEKKYPQIRRPELAALALAFLRAAALLQQQGVKIGDYNSNNFRFDPQRRQLGLIDTDAFQVRHNGGFYVCPVTSPDMTPPELLNEPVKRRLRSPANEIFAAGILAFLILMPGKHPFEALGVEDCSDNLFKGGFPYRPKSGSAGPPTGSVPKGIWGRVWDDFPDSLQECFTAIFLTGHAVPKQRGTRADLIRATAEYAAGLQQGRHFLMPLLGPPPQTPLAAAPPALRKQPAAPAQAFPRPVPAAASAFPGIALAERQLTEAALRIKAFGKRLIEFLVW